MNPKYVTTIADLDNLVGLRSKEREVMETVCQKFPFRSNEYYLSLIDWKDGLDPLKKIIVPDLQELRGGGSFDPSSEKIFTKAPGVQHKYEQTGLLLLSDVCGGICRFCFRKRLFVNEERETVKDVAEGIEYIRSHPEITNVLLTGGDPLILETRKIDTILRALREIDHVHIIRIGSKMLAYNPYRILNDKDLLETLRRHSTPEKCIYLMAHFNHPRELTDISRKAIEELQKCNVIVVNQTPLLKGVNHSPTILADLFRRLSFAGIAPYYVFQCRPSTGNRFFQIPVETSYQIIQTAWKACSGLAKRARFVMSHATGKIEIVGKTAQHVFMRYHQAADPGDIGKFMVFKSNKDATWFDEYDQHLTDLLKQVKMRWLF